MSKSKVVGVLRVSELSGSMHGCTAAHRIDRRLELLPGVVLERLRDLRFDLRAKSQHETTPEARS